MSVSVEEKKLVDRYNTSEYERGFRVGYFQKFESLSRDIRELEAELEIEKELRRREKAKQQ